MIEGNRTSGVLLRSAWLERLASLSAETTLAADVDAFLDAGATDPAGFIRALFDRTGVQYDRVGDRIVLVPQAG